MQGRDSLRPRPGVNGRGGWRRVRIRGWFDFEEEGGRDAMAISQEEGGDGAEAEGEGTIDAGVTPPSQRAWAIVSLGNISLVLLENERNRPPFPCRNRVG